MTVDCTYIRKYAKICDRLKDTNQPVFDSIPWTLHIYWISGKDFANLMYTLSIFTTITQL